MVRLCVKTEQLAAMRTSKGDIDVIRPRTILLDGLKWWGHHKGEPVPLLHDCAISQIGLSNSDHLSKVLGLANLHDLDQIIAPFTRHAPAPMEPATLG